MKSTKLQLSLLLTLFYAISLSAQIQIGGFLGTSYGQITESDDNLFFNSNFGFKAGTSVRANTKCNVYFTGSIIGESIGWAVIQNDRSPDIVIDTYVKGTGITFSVNVGYYIVSNDKLRIGLAAGYRYGQIVDRNYSYVTDNPSNVHVDIFGVYSIYRGLEFKSDLLLKMTDKLDLTVTPIYQLFNRKFQKEDLFIERNFGLHVGMLYSLKKKV